MQSVIWLRVDGSSMPRIKFRIVQMTDESGKSTLNLQIPSLLWVSWYSGMIFVKDLVK